MITHPVIILGAPRSGTTILQRCLALHPDLWHLSSESHGLFEGPFHPIRSGFDSNRVTADQVSDQVASRLRQQFYAGAINLNGVLNDPSWLFTGNHVAVRAYKKLLVNALGALSRIRKPAEIRLLEKTPKNSLRVPLMELLFPDARYIWIKRQAPTNIDSLIAGWRAVDRFGPFTRERFARAGYPILSQLALQDYAGTSWKFALVPEWKRLKGKTLADVATWQYFQCNHTIQQDTAPMTADRLLAVKYEDFVTNPLQSVHDILTWADLPPSPVVDRFADTLPRVNYTPALPHQNAHTLRYEEMVRTAIENLPELDALQRQMGYE